MMVKYHRLIGEYFESKFIYLDKKKCHKPNIRKLVEQPWQQTIALQLDGATETLCNLEFIQAKAALRMTYDLIDDFTFLLERIPESAESITKEKLKQERLDKYANDLILYAKRQLKELEVPESNVPWSEEKIDAEIDRIKNNPTRLDRLNSFYNYLGLEAGILQENAWLLTGLAIQQAWNNYDSGPVGESAYLVVKRIGGASICLSPTRNKWNPLPAKILIINDNFSSYSVSNNWKSILTISTNGECVIWDLKTGRPIKNIPGFVTDLHYSYKIAFNGKLALVDDPDYTCTLWDLESGNPRLTLVGHSDYVKDIDLTSDGSLGLTVSLDGMCILWDLESGLQLLKLMTPDKTLINKIKISENGKYGLCSTWSNAFLWDLENGKLLKQTKFREESFYGNVVMTPDGLKIYLPHEPILLWEWKLDSMINIPISANYFDITPDGKVAVAVDSIETLAVWDVEYGEKIKIINDPLISSFGSLNISPDGELALSKFGDGNLTLWNLKSGAFFSDNLKKHSGSISYIKTTSNGKYIVTCSPFDKSLDNLIVWDAKGGNYINTFDIDGFIWCDLALVPVEEKVIICSNSVNQINSFILDLRSGSMEKSLELKTRKFKSIRISKRKTIFFWVPSVKARFKNHNIENVKALPDGSAAILIISYSNKIILWNLSNRKKIKIIRLHKKPIGNFEISPEGRNIISVSIDKICLWDRIKGKIVKTLRGYEFNPKLIALVPDGRVLVVFTSSNSCLIWNMINARVLESLPLSSKIIGPICISPNGKTILFNTDENKCILFDLLTLRQVYILAGHNSHVTDIKVTPDGKMAVTVSDDKTCIIWDLETGRIIRRFFGKYPLNCISIYNDTAILGGLSGMPVFINLPKSEFSEPIKIVTLRKIWIPFSRSFIKETADCPYCGKRFEPKKDIIDVLKQIEANAGLNPDQSPCLELPQEYWDLPELVSNCPFCGEILKFNPFIAGSFIFK